MYEHQFHSISSHLLQTPPCYENYHNHYQCVLNILVQLCVHILMSMDRDCSHLVIHAHLCLFLPTTMDCDAPGVLCNQCSDICCWVWECYMNWLFRWIKMTFELGTTRQIWGIWKLRPAYSPETPNLGQNQWCFVPCDLEIWWMTLENNRAPLLCCFKLYASFRSLRWIQAGVTVRKRPIWVKIDDFLSRVTLQFDIWPWKTIGHLFCATSSFVHHFVAIGEFKLELQSENAQSGSNSTIFRAVWPWNLTDDLEKQ